MNMLKHCSDGLLKTAGPGLAILKKNHLPFLSVVVTGILTACGPSAEEMRYREQASAIGEQVNAYASKIATDTIDGITHNFMRTADLRLKVTDLITTSNTIEDLVNTCGGYITLSDLNSTIHANETVKTNKDSVTEITHYTMVNALRLRIPNKKLDTVIRAISGLAAFIDQRKLTADDAKMALYANSLAEKRYETFQKHIRKNTGPGAGSKANLKTEEIVLEKQALQDQVQLESYNLVDQVNYATVNIALYQPEQIKTLTRYQQEPAEPYVPPFTWQLAKSLERGLDVLKSGVVMLSGLWGFALLSVMLVYAFGKLKPLLYKLFQA